MPRLHMKRSLGSGRDVGAMEAARRVCCVSANKKLGRHRSSWNDIEGRQVRAAAPRAAQGANGRREVSGRSRKSISSAKTAGARRPIGGERSTSNILVSLDPRTYRETRGHAGSVMGTTSSDYATTTTSSRAGRTRGRESRRSRQTRSPSRTVGPGD